ncbi:MAG: hypothetical protein IIA87_01350 [Nanoarchaeota archaeon]|nr:hypothetical protein [Nanoarchaeota archaeon]
MPYTRFFTDSIRMLLVDCERGWPQPLPLDPPQEEFSHPYYHFRRCGDVLIELVADNDALLSRMIERLEKLG